MAIPLRMRLLWAVLSRLPGESVLQLPPDQIPKAREQRRRLVSLPGAALITGTVPRDVAISTLDADGIPVRVYRPPGATALPLIVNYHGGGFVSGDPEQSGWWCASIARAVPAVVVSVDYRLAPEHPFPAAPDDCFAATRWAVEHAERLGADGSRLAVMGDSAGGNLAAVVSVMARDRGGPPIALQVLIYPAVDMDGSYPSEDENAHAPILGKADLGVDRIYCPDDRKNPYASPLFARHDGLPPALIQTAQHDPLRDQGEVYADALRLAGVPVRITNYVDAVHGYISVPRAVPVASQALGEAIAELRGALR